MIGLTDTAYLGRVGEVELGASALAGVYYLVIYMLGFGFSVGAQVLIARRNGAQDYTRIGPVFMQGALFLLLLAATLFTVSHFYSPVILRKLIGSDEVYQATMSYIDWRVYGFFFSFIAVMFRAFYVGITKTKILTANSVVMVLTNVVLNYILIFGKFGFPALGIAGAAIASSISEAVSVLFFIIYTWKKIDYKKYGMFSFTGIDFRMLKQILNVSIWIMVQHGIAFIGWFIFFVVMEHQGERPLAITNVVRSISSFLFMFVNAFASTSSSLVSNLIGAGEIKCVPGTIRQHIRIGYIFVLPLVILFALFPNLILSIYKDIPDLREASIPSLWVLCSAYLILVPANVYFQAVSGTGNTRTALGLELCVLAIYLIYITYMILYLRVDVAVCWTTEHLYGICILFLSYLYIKKGNWQKKQILPDFCLSSQHYYGREHK